MKQQALVPVLLAGGIGSRLWPLSREHYPKQLLALLGKDSLLQATLRRILAVAVIEHFIVICNEEHRFEVLTQIQEVTPSCDFTIILEPMGRNTAAAVALAAFYFPHEVNLLFLPADHILQSEPEFVQQVQLANQYATEGYLLTFGIKPTYPESGYGYIQTGQEIAPQIFTILQFAEKPDQHTAAKFLQAGNYYWNSGMFLFAKQTLLEEIYNYAPMIYSTVRNVAKTFIRDNYFIRISADLFSKVPDLSIDYAIMEYTKKALMLPLTTAWSDIGSWQSLFEYETKNTDNTVVIGDVINIDNKNCYLRSDTHLMAAVGVENIIAVQTADCVLITNVQQSQRVKEIVQLLKHQQRNEALEHLTQYHPWGVSTIINRDKDFVIRRVDINPGQALSLHSHTQSSESWLLIKGNAKVNIDNAAHYYQAGDSFSVHINQRHQIANNGTEVLSMVEVRTGKDLSNKDIVRYE